MKSRFLQIAAAAALVLTAASAGAASVAVSEPTSNIRLERYNERLYIWRLPNQGTSTFPSSGCVTLNLSPDVNITREFLALFLYAKSNAKPLYIHYDNVTCAINSFGIDG